VCGIRVWGGGEWGQNPLNVGDLIDGRKAFGGSGREEGGHFTLLIRGVARLGAGGVGSPLNDIQEPKHSQ